MTVKHPEPVEAFAELKQMDPPCNHCYCQPSESVRDVLHQACCKCGDRMATPGLVVPEPRLSPREARRLRRKMGRIDDDAMGRPKPV